MFSPRRTLTTHSHGSDAHTEFNDKSFIPDFKTSVITRIVVAYDTSLRAIKVDYGASKGAIRGCSVSRESELILPPGEFITTMRGSKYDNRIARIEFATNMGRKWGPFGDMSPPNTFVWDGYGYGMGLLYFAGRADSSYVRSLRATFAMYINLADRPAGLQYERHEFTEMGIPLTRFATNLMSPSAMLVVGVEQIEFVVSQRLLCRIPFFHAALKGEFLEAVEQKITMSEDEPQDIAAFVEFLSTGSYTYPYHTIEDSMSSSPRPDLDEGYYHIGVYTTAEKYDCNELQALSLKFFLYVLSHLEGIEVALLWKSAFVKDMLSEDLETYDGLEEFRRGLPELVKELYTIHREEMEDIAAEHPLFVSEMLRLIVID